MLDEVNPGLAITVAVGIGVVSAALVGPVLGTGASVAVLGLYARAWAGSCRDAVTAWAAMAVLAVCAAGFRLFGGPRTLGL